MTNRVNVYIPKTLGQRAEDAGIANLSYICQAAIAAACEAIESGRTTTITFDVHLTPRIVVRAEGEAPFYPSPRRRGRQAGSGRLDARR
jgi:hypothetical protein